MYCEHYGLSERPFQLTPDPRFWYESRTHRKAMAYLGYGLAQGEGFIVITGDIGSGKTTLVGHLLETIDNSRFVVVNIVSTQVEGDDMLRLVAQGLGLPTDGVPKAQVMDRIERMLDDHARAGKHVLIIVDEAQNIPTSALEELRMLSNYHVRGRSLVQIILLGQPEFRDRLREADDLEQLRQRVIATHHLDPLEADEIEPYVLHRLKQAGHGGDPSFAPEAFAVLLNRTGGVPRMINTLMARVMLYGAIEDIHHFDGAVIAEVADDQRADGERRPGTESTYRRRGDEAGFSPSPAVAVEIERRVEVPYTDPEVDARLAQLEARLDEQDAALRRILGLLIDWLEAGEPAPQRQPMRHSDAA